jgi:hypothetical protein
VVERHDRRAPAAAEVLAELRDLNCEHDGSFEDAIEQGQLPEAVLGSAG